MAKVEIAEELKEEIFKKFNGDSKKIFRLMLSLGESPRKGKLLGHVGGVAIKELKYKSFRFYFVVDAYKVKFLEIDELEDLLIKFVRMSDKRNQQKVIGEIREFLERVRGGKF